MAQGGKQGSMQKFICFHLYSTVVLDRLWRCCVM